MSQPDTRYEEWRRKDEERKRQDQIEDEIVKGVLVALILAWVLLCILSLLWIGKAPL